tara:strand:- start:126 stop:575 length:450 start_codon:yes stop_codon:yes gene_type:complete
MATWQTQIKQISMALSVVGALWMALTVGLGDAFNIVTDPASVDAATTASLGGIDFIDRVAVAGVFVTLLGGAGLGVVSISGNNPPAVNTILRYAPVIIGFVAFSAFGSEAWDLISGNRTWANFDDIQNSYMLFLASSMVSAIVGLLDRR